MHKISIYLILFCVSCSSSVRYPGYEFVRIEGVVPSKLCQYKVQESCNMPTVLEGCYNWYKKRATTYSANIVVLHNNGIADYYNCP
jgi:hypothetical protein